MDDILRVCAATVKLKIYVYILREGGHSVSGISLCLAECASN